MKNKHTPEIRFPEYSGDWEERKIGEFLKESRISGTNGLEAKKITVKLWGKGVIPKDEIYQGSEATKYYIRKAGQFIYGKLDFLHQAFGIIPDKLDGYESTLDLPAFDIVDNLNSFFFLEYVSRKQFYLYQGTIANGSRKAKRIHSETFLEMPLIVPTVEEQTDIGNFFKNLDDTIALQEQELTTLKQTKQGFLQKMFPKEGESVPEVRFPGFTGIWKQCRLGRVVDVLDGDRGKNYPSGNDLLEKGHTVFLNANNITKNGFSFEEMQYITEQKSNSMGNGKVNIGDTILTSRGTVGNIAYYNGYINKKIPYARINSGMLILRPSEDIYPGYITQYLRSFVGTKQIKFISFGSAQPQLTKRDVTNFEISIPMLTEQKRITSILEKLDDTIALHQRELDALKETKKAFLQKMFV
ncbi:restriction endonuclease subunit S [Brevibacillus laterosporus]|uniref:restriction endonuclease subunit S n=1 Tax=Brevibacillus laterosporus TaxID=1465 RepID=UPI000CE51592|nr:restriction endonuclease subunit S [Brevibacillus laterosporus]PPA83592.1 restriction endonuclease subunit S [Brevibacillus laterosporus]